MKNSLKLLLLFLFIQAFGLDSYAQEVSRTYTLKVFDDKGFGGKSQSYTVTGTIGKQESYIDLGSWNDRMSSIEVPKGLKVSLYRDKGGDTKGKDNYMVMYSGGCDNLNSYNDDVSSLVLEIVPADLPIVALYDQGERKGTYQTLGPGKYDTDQLLMNDGISGIEIGKLLNVTLYDDKGQTGSNPLELNKESYRNKFLNLDDYEFNDRASSIEIKRTDYVLISSRTIGEGNVLNTIKEPSGASISLVNDRGQMSNIKETITYTYNETTTTDWSNAISAGLSVTIGQEAGATVGPISASQNISATVSISNTFTFGKSSTISDTKTITASVSADVGPHETAYATLFIENVTMAFTIEFTYAPVIMDDKGHKSYDKNEDNWEKIREKVKLQYATKGQAIISDSAFDPESTSTSYNYSEKTSKTTTTPSLGVDTKLQTGDVMWSPQRRYQLKMQKDGNLCINTANHQFVWCTMSQSRNGAYAILQKDGNFVVYDNNNTWKWDAQTHTLPRKPKRLVLDDNGKLKLLDLNNNTLKILNK